MSSAELVGYSYTNALLNKSGTHAYSVLLAHPYLGMHFWRGVITYLHSKEIAKNGVHLCVLYLEYHTQTALNSNYTLVQV